MKKVSLMVIGATVALGMLFTSCKKDEKTAPSVSMLQLGDKAINVSKVDTVVVTADTDYKFSWSVSKGSSDLTKLDIKVVGTAVSDTAFTDAAKIAGGSIADASFDAGNTMITFTVTDKDNQTVTVAFVVKATAVGTPLTVAHSGIKLGNANDTKNGSYYSLLNGAMLTADAKTKATSVDFAYNGTVISPNAVTNTDIKTANASRITKFKVLPATFNFDNATTADLAALTIDGTSATADNGAIIAFVTQEGKKGILKITDKVTTGTGDATVSTITITVKK